MQEGKILAASHDGAYVIRLQGDVRLTLCTTIDEYFQHMYEDPAFASVWVDLCEAEGIDRPIGSCWTCLWANSPPW